MVGESSLSGEVVVVCVGIVEDVAVAGVVDFVVVTVVGSAVVVGVNVGEEVFVVGSVLITEKATRRTQGIVSSWEGDFPHVGRGTDGNG